MPDMTLSAALTAAIAAYVAAEFGDCRGALVAFYGSVGLAFWAKGPVGLLPLAVAMLDLLIRRGWSGPKRLVSIPGLALLLLEIAPWWITAVVVGREQFTHGTVLNDGLLWYLPTRGSGWLKTEPVSQTLAILFPWSILLPIAIWWATRRAAPEVAQRARLPLVWGATVFLLIAVSQQQRMRYYLPLCPPAALLIALRWSRLTLRRRMALFTSVWAVVAISLGLWRLHTLSHSNPATPLGAIAAELP